jgi:hypothetical protein
MSRGLSIPTEQENQCRKADGQSENFSHLTSFPERKTTTLDTTLQPRKANGLCHFWVHKSRKKANTDKHKGKKQNHKVRACSVGWNYRPGRIVRIIHKRNTIANAIVTPSSMERWSILAGFSIISRKTNNWRVTAPLSPLILSRPTTTPLVLTPFLISFAFLVRKPQRNLQ